MRLGARIALVGVLAVALMTVTVPSALATTQQVPTPAGTFYVTENHQADLNPRLEEVCLFPIGSYVICLPAGANPQTPRGHVTLWEETNGCSDLQTKDGDCDDDGISEPADDKVEDIVY